MNIFDWYDSYDGPKSLIRRDGAWHASFGWNVHIPAGLGCAAAAGREANAVGEAPDETLQILQREYLKMTDVVKPIGGVHE